MSRRISTNTHNVARAKTVEVPEKELAFRVALGLVVELLSGWRRSKQRAELEEPETNMLIIQTNKHGSKKKLTFTS